MRKLVPATAVAVVLFLAGCSGNSPASPSKEASPRTKAKFSTNESCGQLFDKGDEGRLLAAITFLVNYPDPVAPKDKTRAAILAGDLEYVAGSANEEMKPHIDTMARTLRDFASTEGEKASIDIGPFKTAATNVVHLCPEQEAAYDKAAADKKAADEAAAKKAADKKAAEEAAAQKAAEAAAAEAARNAPREYTGTGDDVLTITKNGTGPQVAIITHIGSSNFIVRTLDSALDSNDLLVNEIGNYSGTVLFDAYSRRAETTALEIKADGSWTVKLVPMSSVRSFDGSTPIAGRGDEVFAYTGPAKAAAFTHDGTSNIAVKYFGSRSDLLINEIGAYTGTVVWAPGFYQVTADGNWSATLK